MSYRNFGIDLGGQKATNAADGTATTDLATVGQVNAARQAVDLKDPVRVVSVANQSTLSGLLTIDGVTLAAGDRVLLAGQTTQSQNGVWVVASGAWTRATDADENAEVTPGFTVAVLQGTQKGTGTNQSNIIRYSLQNTGAIVVGTTALTFAPEGSTGNAAPTSGSGGISVAGTAISFVPKSGGGLAQDAGGAYIDPTSQYARRAPYAADVPSTTAGSNFTMTHNLNTLDVIWQIFRKSDGVLIDFPDVSRDANSVTLNAPVALAASAYRFLALPL